MNSWLVWFSELGFKAQIVYFLLYAALLDGGSLQRYLHMIMFNLQVSYYHRKHSRPTDPFINPNPDRSFIKMQPESRALCCCNQIMEWRTELTNSSRSSTRYPPPPTDRSAHTLTLWVNWLRIINPEEHTATDTYRLWERKERWSTITWFFSQTVEEEVFKGAHSSAFFLLDSF